MAGKRFALLCLLFVMATNMGCAGDGTSAAFDAFRRASADAALETEGSAQLFAMDTVMSITANGEDAQVAVDEAVASIYELEDLFAVTNRGSDIFSLNTASSLAVSAQTIDIITRAIEISDMTGGLFNIAMYPIIREWGFTTGEYKIPDTDTLKALLRNIDYNEISLEGRDITLPKDMEIDVGGLAKGYAGDVAGRVLEEKGITSGLINLGGDVQVIGTKPNGADWRVAIQNPEGEGYICVLSVSDTTVMTSGSYERYFTGNDGNDYHHIMDPRTGAPANSGLISVTVVADSGCTGDALATALFIMGMDKATEFWRDRGGFEAIFMTDTGDISITEGLIDSFELSKGFQDVQVNTIGAR